MTGSIRLRCEALQRPLVGGEVDACVPVRDLDLPARGILDVPRGAVRTLDGAAIERLDALARVRRTGIQGGPGARSRRANGAGAFRARATGCLTRGARIDARIEGRGQRVGDGPRRGAAGQPVGPVA